MKGKRLAVVAAALMLSAASAFARVTSAKSVVKNLADLLSDMADTVLLVVEILIGLAAGVFLLVAFIDNGGDQPQGKMKYFKWAGGFLFALIGIELIKNFF